MFEESLGTMLVTKNARVYLGHSRRLLRSPYIRIRTLLDTASGDRSYLHALIDIDRWEDISVAFCCELVGYVGPGQGMPLVPFVSGV